MKTKRAAISRKELFAVAATESRRAATTTKTAKNIFPKIKTKGGGYTVGIRFMDEARGERYFDTEWSVTAWHEAGSFSIPCPVSYNGRMIWQDPAGNSIGRDIRVGDTLSLTITRWSMRGRSETLGRSITVKAVAVGDAGDYVTITY